MANVTKTEIRKHLKELHRELFEKRTTYLRDLKEKEQLRIITEQVDLHLKTHAGYDLDVLCGKLSDILEDISDVPEALVEASKGSTVYSIYEYYNPIANLMSKLFSYTSPEFVIAQGTKAVLIHDKFYDTTEYYKKDVHTDEFAVKLREIDKLLALLTRSKSASAFLDELNSMTHEGDLGDLLSSKIFKLKPKETAIAIITDPEVIKSLL